jgi:hypothetical protein
LEKSETANAAAKNSAALPRFAGAENLAKTKIWRKRAAPNALQRRNLSDKVVYA